MRRHMRGCFGKTFCEPCQQPFPCRGKFCPDTRAEAPDVPAEFMPYFYRSDQDWRRPEKPEVAAIKPAALAWLESLGVKRWQRPDH